MIERFERFSTMISEISRCVHKISSDEMEKYGLKGSYARYLVAMYNYPEGVTAASLSEVCGRDKSDISRAMSEMEKKGLVLKLVFGENKYRALITLTDEGKKAAEYIRERAALAVEQSGKGISVENRTLLYDSLTTILKNMQKICEEGLADE